MNPNVDMYIAKSKKWSNELQRLRSIVLECGLMEEFKWKSPCYSFNGSNLIIIGSFKDNCVLSFVKGSLLQDSEKILIQQTENSQAVRIIRFPDMEDIISKEAIIKAYIFEAIEAEKAGLKVEYKTDLNPICDELLVRFEEAPELKKAFEALTPGRQRGYNMHFNSTKNPATRFKRIDSYTDRIMKGQGMRDCVCGLSKRMPNCDGSHKQLEA
jgi:uncharacterized protein YdeI (YjbR/CyaY-like superfamily)